MACSVASGESRTRLIHTCVGALHLGDQAQHVGVLRCNTPFRTACGLTVKEQIYAPEESNIIPQSNAGPGGTRPDLLVLQVGCPWQGKPSRLYNNNCMLQPGRYQCIAAGPLEPRHPCPKEPRSHNLYHSNMQQCQPDSPACCWSSTQHYACIHGICKQQLLLLHQYRGVYHQQLPPPLPAPSPTISAAGCNCAWCNNLAAAAGAACLRRRCSRNKAARCCCFDKMLYGCAHNARTKSTR
jgi:hypothetical protein